uniref:NAD(+) kinase n=1 Tax=Timema tahoe TaxID=61484 RepID=A0A7R9NZB5_9NEOP|nr:unnamed protein product [Timema tahoe]
MVASEISVSPDSRNTSWVSFDGRNRQELLHGDSVVFENQAPPPLCNTLTLPLCFPCERKILVTAGNVLQIMLNNDARSTAWVSLDGRFHQELVPGDSLRVTTSIYPVPSICAQDQISDWFDSLAECLHWNVRKRQKHLDELSDLTHSSSNDTLDSLDHTDHLDS